MKAFLFFVAFLLTACLAETSAQSRYNNNWAMGSGGGLSFNSGGPMAQTTAIVSGEGVATISDSTGQLLFYTNGKTIWNRNHTIMANGGGLLGDLSSAQGVVIIPLPAIDQYYVFTVGSMEGGHGELYYSIVDMQANGGLGAVVPSQKNKYLSSDHTEALISAKGPGCSYWLIAHHKDNNEFKAWQITRAGIINMVASSVGSIHINPVGLMKMSPDDKRIAVSHTNGGSFLEVLDFDATTGVISNPIKLPLPPNQYSYGVCFSPDNSKLYASEGRQGTSISIIQFDLSVSATNVEATRTIVGTAAANGPYGLSDLQLGPDQVIYFTRWLTPCFGSIPNPNAKAPNCGFVESAVCFGTPVGLCLPNSVRVLEGPKKFSLGPDTTACLGSTITLTSPIPNASYLWSTNATAPSISVQTAGQYWLEVTINSCSLRDTIEVNFGEVRPNLGNDTSICVGTTIQLSPGQYQTYQWQDGTTTPIYAANAPGLYWVETVDACGQRNRDSVSIAEVRFPVSLGPDKRICEGDTILLQATNGFTNYSWGPSYQLNSGNVSIAQVFPSRDTNYFVRAERMPGCFSYDTIAISIQPAQKVQLPPDTAFCAGQSITLSTAPGFSHQLWHNGSSQSSITIRQPTTAWVQARDGNGCRSRDSVVLTIQDCGQELWMPNAFTPNRDGRNDLFRASYKGYFEAFQLSIYNRWGQVVYSSSNPDQGWNGRLGGKDIDSGVFVWICTYRFFGRTTSTQKGTVTLIR